MMKISNMTTSDLAKLTSSAKETYPALTAMIAVTARRN